MFAFRNWREEEPMKKILVITIACLLLSGIFSTTVRADGGAPPPCDPFFFSSRRRHTRSYGDWSSDVCSSDLIRIHTGSLHPCLVIDERMLESDDVRFRLLEKERVGHGIVTARRRAGIGIQADGRAESTPGLQNKRSEERRVGKACRTGVGRWS